MVDAYERPIFSFLARMVGDEEIAVELTQETFLRCFRSLDRVRPGSPLKPWLFRIARNIAIDYLRRAEHAYPQTGEGIEGFANEAAGRRAMNPEREAQVAQRMRTIARALPRLRPAYREALLLHLVDGLSYTEMALATETSVDAVKSRFLRARLRLRQLVAAEDRPREGEER